MKINIVKDYNAMSLCAFNLIANVIKKSTSPVISLTTGASPTGIFKLIVNAVNEGDLDISDTIFLNVDEYVGNQNDVYTVHTFMFQHLYNKINAKPRYFDMFNAGNKNKDFEILRYKHILNTYPRDVQLLGLGVNGHIGACEPGTPFDATTFCARHKPSTIESTMRLYNISRDEAPDEMFTLGFREIMDAKMPILVASGISKAEAVRRLLEEPVNEECPASFLTTHPDFVLIVDEEAASLLSEETRKCAIR
ncbi:TPA: glucosamine-6-phosphate deaminase [Salmonella enterica]|nr:glucosamine-6-phosphate deaminase [Salmonella enterica]